MTFKELQKIIHHRQSESDSDQTRFFNRLKGKAFWIWNVEQHKVEDRRTNGECCFNHIIGLPQKDGIEKPLYGYQKTIIDALERYRHVYILKATGLGISELALRWTAWMCVKDNQLQDSQVVVVTGPRLELATTLISRLKKLFEPHNIFFDSKETVLELNKVHIEAYPSHHIADIRGLRNVSIIILDESAFFPLSQATEARDASERYIGKSNPYILLISTPNTPGDLMEMISKEPAETCLYHRIYLDYTYGLDKIYSREEIAKAKASPSWEREYNLKFLGSIGIILSFNTVDKAVARGQEQQIRINPLTPKIMGLDPAFGSSAFGIVIVQMESIAPNNNTNKISSQQTDFRSDSIQVLYSEDFVRPDFNAMLAVIRNLAITYGFTRNNGSQIYVDASASAFIRSLKLELKDNPDWDGVIARTKGFRQVPAHWLGSVIPIAFNTEHKKMLWHLKVLMDSGFVAIRPDQTKLIMSLKSAWEENGSLNKDRTVHSDIFDAFRLCLQHFKLGPATDQ